MKTYQSLACLLLSMLPAAAVGTQDKATVQQAIAAAKAAQKEADALQGGWRSTDALIKKAEKLATEGERNKALEVADKARREAGLARAQAEHERQHWSPPPYAQPGAKTPGQ